MKSYITITYLVVSTFLSAFECAKRNNVVETGIKIWPKVADLKRGQGAIQCPKTHPFTFDGYSKCCAFQYVAFDPPDFKGEELLPRHEQAACNDFVQCQDLERKCRTHEDFRRKTLTYLAVFPRYTSVTNELSPDAEIELISLERKTAVSVGTRIPEPMTAIAPEFTSRFATRANIEYEGRVTFCNVYAYGSNQEEHGCLQYDTGANAFSRMPDLPPTHVEPSMAMFNGNLWAIGGMFTTVMTYLVKDENVWVPYVSHSLSRRMIYHNFVPIGDSEAYLMGGYDLDISGFTDEVFYFTLANGFEPKQSMPTAKAAFAAHFYQHPNGTRFIITAGGGHTTLNVATFFINEVAIYNIDEDSWFTSNDPDFNLPTAGAFYHNFNGFMYENVYYVGCFFDNDLNSNPNLYGFLVDGPDDFTWTNVGEITLRDKYPTVLCNSIKLQSRTLYYH